MKDVSQQEWRELIKNDVNAVIIDVRTPEEWEDGIQENAQMMNVQDTHAFMDAASSLDKGKNYYMYCRSGGRSQMACQVLGSIGIENTYNLLGGMMEWDGITTTP